MRLKDQNVPLERNRGHQKFAGQIHRVLKERPPRAKDRHGWTHVTKIVETHRQGKISSDQNEIDHQEKEQRLMLKAVKKISVGKQIDKDEEGDDHRWNLKNDQEEKLRPM